MSLLRVEIYIWSVGVTSVVILLWVLVNALFPAMCLEMLLALQKLSISMARSIQNVDVTIADLYVDPNASILGVS